MSHHAETNGASNGTNKFPNLKALPHVVKPLDRRQKVLPNVLHGIGNTPLVKLNKIPQAEGLKCDMYAKCEFLNPGGSVKDRIAYRMIQDAEDKGVIQPGKSVIIEPTSGNTGIGLALASAVKGYRCIIVLPEKMSDEKVNTLKALGAEIVRTPMVPSSHPESNLSVAERLAKEIPGGIVLDQYNNPCNPLAHYDTTGEEILWSLDDSVDMVVLGTGTCGTVSGIGHKVKERAPNCIIVGVDPHGSILAEPEELNKSTLDFYEVEGLGYDFLPTVLDRGVVDRWVKSDDKDSLIMARRLISEEGLLCGGSAGSVMWAAVQAARSLGAGQKCVVLLPDSIRNYMTKHISDQWLEARDFKTVDNNSNVSWWNTKVTESMVQRVSSVPLSATLDEAISAMHRSKAPLLTVLDNNGAIAGIVTADATRKRLATVAKPGDNLDKFVQSRFYSVDMTRAHSLGRVSRLLDITPHVLVTHTDSSGIARPVGVMTSEDLLYHATRDKQHTNGN